MSESPNKVLRQIDDVIHSKIRLGIMLSLYEGTEIDFNYLKEKLEITDGNLSAHMKKLVEEGYVKAKKRFINNKPNTAYEITKKGAQALRVYLDTMRTLLGGIEEKTEITLGTGENA